MSRTRFDARERAIRSRLAKLVHDRPVLRGTLTRRALTCGKPNCRCATGEKHEYLYLSCSRQGTVHQVYVPRRIEEQVQRWVANYREALALLEELSDRSWDTLHALKKHKG